MLPPATNNVWNLKLKSGSRMIPVEITKDGDRLFFKFGFAKPLMEEIKAMEGHKWHGYDENNPRKIWSVKDCQRNRFQIAYLAFPASGDPRNPYYHYDLPLIDYKSYRTNPSPYNHQLGLTSQGLTRHYTELAAEMGTGKTLAAIEIMEESGNTDWWWVGPKSALVSVKLEFKKWKARFTPRWYTYEGFQKALAEWTPGVKAPFGVVFDEASRLKNPKAKRTIAAMGLANAIREEWGMKGFVILMSGSPAPKSPVDWWSQCEIAQPGFIREGTVDKFRQRLAIIEMRESFGGGGAFPNLKTWKDDERKCNICGLFADAETHELPEIAAEGVDVFKPSPTCHVFQPSVNEVALLYQRMNGLVKVLFKKDCLDLPDKIYREVILKPTQSTLNASRAIEVKSPSTIQALTLLRELSDGFQYVSEESGTQVCSRCNGRKECEYKEAVGYPECSPEEFEKGVKFDEELEEWTDEKLVIKDVTGPCPKCNGTGEEKTYVRGTKQIPTPKEEALKDLLDEHDDIGRLVVFGGFTGTLDRIQSIVQAAHWDWIRVDGRGWASSIPAKDDQELLTLFQTGQVDWARVCFIGHPGSAGMGLTLTASPTICYYSNDFNAESRIQSEDRIHRAGMDVARGATIIDFIHLPSDKLVLDNLKRKRRLQDITMGEMKAAITELETSLDAVDRAY